MNLLQIVKNKTLSLSQVFSNCSCVHKTRKMQEFEGKSRCVYKRKYPLDCLGLDLTI